MVGYTKLIRLNWLRINYMSVKSWLAIIYFIAS